MKAARNVAFLTCAATLVLIGVGVYVRATGSGLGCPDWPTCHGGVVPPGERQAVIEFTHRAAAAVVGLLAIATAALAWRSFRHAPAPRWAALATVPLVGVQGGLGALTVARELPPEIVATHLLLAVAILSVMAAAAIGMHADMRGAPAPAERAAALRVARRAGLALALFAAVVWMGGWLGESGAATACEGWPTCNGGVLPGADDQQIAHMAHRYLAAALAVPLGAAALAMWRERTRLRWAAPAATATVALYATQVAAGALNVWYAFPDALTVTHTVLAASLWLTLSAAALPGFLALAGERRRTGATGAEAPA